MMEDLKPRTRQYALRVIRLFTALPTTAVAQVLGKQLLRSGTSVGAHYREGCRARSTAEFISKLAGGLQELEETAHSLELPVRGGARPPDKSHSLHEATAEWTAVVVSHAPHASRN